MFISPILTHLKKCAKIARVRVRVCVCVLECVFLSVPVQHLAACRHDRVEYIQQHGGSAFGSAEDLARQSGLICIKWTLARSNIILSVCVCVRGGLCVCVRMCVQIEADAIAAALAEGFQEELFNKTGHVSPPGSLCCKPVRQAYTWCLRPAFTKRRAFTKLTIRTALCMLLKNKQLSIPRFPGLAPRSWLNTQVKLVQKRCMQVKRNASNRRSHAKFGRFRKYVPSFICDPAFAMDPSTWDTQPMEACFAMVPVCNPPL